MRQLGGWVPWLHTALAAALALVVIAVYAEARRAPAKRASESAHRPVEQPSPGFATSDTCRACHPGAHATWSDSYHRTMTAEATPEFVHGDFGGPEGRTLEYGPLVFRVRRDGDRFLVSQRVVSDPSLAIWDDRPLVLVTGSHHMQIYWYETGQGRTLAQLPFAYLKHDQRWVPRGHLFLHSPSRGIVLETGRWNMTCITCHTTQGQPRPTKGGQYDTRVSELGIACEACHGPAEAHLERFQSPLSRYAAHLGPEDGRGETDIVNPKHLDHERASQICSPCHAMWQFEKDGYAAFSENGYAYRPGEDPEETMWLFAPSRADTDERVREVVRDHPKYTRGQFWSDGQARVSGREFTGMQDSACFTRGEMSCLSCHSMHQQDNDGRSAAQWADDQLAVDRAGDEACLQCHDGYRADPSAHTGHAEGSAGSRCYNCHMPYTSYGLLKAIRSHKVTNPTVDETLETGRINACNACHVDRSLAWTAEALKARHGVQTRGTIPESEADVAATVVHALRGNAAQRALAAWALGWGAARDAARASGAGDRFMQPLLGLLMDDPYAAVRYVAQHALDHHLASSPAGAVPGLDYDYVPEPGHRDPVAPDVIAHAVGRAPLEVPDGIPLRADGGLSEVGQTLFEARDDTPINLLE